MPSLFSDQSFCSAIILLLLLPCPMTLLNGNERSLFLSFSTFLLHSPNLCFNFSSFDVILGEGAKARDSQAQGRSQGSRRFSLQFFYSFIFFPYAYFQFYLNFLRLSLCMYYVEASQCDLFPQAASCKCYFFDNLGKLSPNRLGDGSDRRFHDVLRRRFLRQG